jgi:betaine-aldehyde dehydrogenase
LTSQQTTPDTVTSYPIEVPSRDKVFIAGRWVESTGTDSIAVVDPSSEQVAATVRVASSEDIDRALEAARAVFDAGTWRLKPVDERARALEILADRLEGRLEELASLNVVELGTPIKVARGMNAAPIGQLRTIARQLRELPLRTERTRSNGLTSLVMREPVGVVSAIIPWNTPHNQFSFKVGPAMAAGCSVVLKTASKTPLVMSAIADVIEDMTTDGILPPGVFSLVLARHSDGEMLVTDPRVDMLSFTGSTEAGRRLGALATKNLARVTLELGGKSAAIILDDADLDIVMASLPMSGMRNSGQTCVALTRVLVSSAGASAARGRRDRRRGPLG